MPFEKGKSGNPLGGRKAKVARDALVQKLLEAGEDMPSLRKVWGRIIEKAEEGDIQCAKEIFDRLDGKVPQAIIGDESEAPIKTVLEVAWKASMKDASSAEGSN